MKVPCPDEERLAEYLEDRLPEVDRFRMEEHLSDCRICLEGIVVSNSLIRGTGRFELEHVPAEVTESAVHLVTGRNSIFPGSLANKLEGSVKDLGSKLADVLRLHPWGKWHPAPIRSVKRVASEDLVCISVPFKGIKTEIEIEKTEADKANIRVIFPKAYKPGKSVRITLKKGEREIASYLLDGDYVLFEDISFGQYGIFLAEDGLKLGTYLFEIKENRHGRR